MNSYAWYIGAGFGFLSLLICFGSLIYCCLKWSKRNNNSASKRVKRDRNNEIHINSDSNTIDHDDTGKTVTYLNIFACSLVHPLRFMYKICRFL